MSAPQPERDASLSTTHLQKDIGSRSIRGGTVVMAAQLVKVVLQFGTIIILARLLEPAAFGLIAMVAALLMFLEYFKDLGLSYATVQRQEISHADVSTLFWCNVGLGFVTTAIAAVLAPGVAWFFGQPKLLGVTLCLSIGFAISGLGTQQMAILRRQMRFNALAAIQLLSEGIGMGVAVASALLGAGYWAIVWQRLAYAVVMTLVAWILCGWIPGRPGRGTSFRSLLAFGGNITGANLINFATRNIDQVLIGWYWGPAALGFYDRSNRLLQVLINNVNLPLFGVLMPTLSRLADDPARYRRVYLRTVELLAMLTMPAAAIMLAAPEAIVLLLFGDKWLPAVPILQFFGIAALYQSATYTCSWLFISQDRTGEMLRWGLIGSALTVAAVLPAVPFGAAAVAGSYTITGLLIRLPALFWMVGRHGPITAGNLYSALLPSSLATLIAVGAIYYMQQQSMMMGLGPVATLAIDGTIAGLVALVCFLAIPQSRHTLFDIGIVTGLIRRREARA